MNAADESPAVELFLTHNGWSLTAGDVDCVLAMSRLASGEWTDAAFAAWVRDNAVQN